MLREEVNRKNKIAVRWGVISAGATIVILFMLGMMVESRLNPEFEILGLAAKAWVDNGYCMVVALIAYGVAWLVRGISATVATPGGADPCEAKTTGECDRMIAAWHNRRKEIEQGDAETKKERKELIGRVSALESIISAGNYGAKEKGLFEKLTGEKVKK